MFLANQSNADNLSLPHLTSKLRQYLTLVEIINCLFYILDSTKEKITYISDSEVPSRLAELR